MLCITNNSIKHLPWLELVYHKKYFNLTKLFVLRLVKMAANQSGSGLNRNLSSNLWWLRNANHVRFTEESMMCVVKHVLVKKCLQMGLPLWAGVENAAYGLEALWLSSKEKWSVKKVMLTEFWDMKGPITIDLLEKGAGVNNSSYCQLLRRNSPYLLTYIYIYIYIVIYRLTFLFYPNSSVCLDIQDALSWDWNLPNFMLDLVSYCSAISATYDSSGIMSLGVCSYTHEFAV